MLNTKPFFVIEHMNYRNLMKSFPKNISKFGTTLTLIWLKSKNRDWNSSVLKWKGKNIGKSSEKCNQDDQSLEQLPPKDQERDAAACGGHPSPHVLRPARDWALLASPNTRTGRHQGKPSRILVQNHQGQEAPGCAPSLESTVGARSWFRRFKGRWESTWRTEPLGAAESQNGLEGWKDLKYHLVPTPLPRAGTPSSGPGCSMSHPTWPGREEEKRKSLRLNINGWRLGDPGKKWGNINYLALLLPFARHLIYGPSWSKMLDCMDLGLNHCSCFQSFIICIMIFLIVNM